MPSSHLNEARPLRLPRAPSRAGAVAAVLLVAALTKANCLVAVFVWDDDGLIVGNVHIRRLSRAPSFFRPSFWREHHMTGGEVYRPIRLSTFALDYAIWGLNPAGFHLTNLLLHLATVLLVCRLLRQWPVTRRFWLPAALLFAVRPTDVETVVWIKNRSDLLAALCFFGALVALRPPLGAEGSRGRTSVALLCFVCALMAKEVAVVLPLLLMLVLTDPRQWRRGWMRTIPFWLAAAVYLAVRAKFLVTPPSGSASVGGPALVERVEAVAVTLAAYARLLLLPVNLTLDHLAPLQTALSGGASHVAALAIAVVAGIAMFASDRRVGILAVLWFGITLAPISNVIPLRDRPLAEPRRYVAALGFCLLVAAAARQRRRRPAAASLLLTIAIASAALSVARAMPWSSNVALWRAAVRATPRLARPLSNLGNAYMLSGRPQRAEQEYRRALRAAPRLHEATLRMGQLLEERGDFQKAMGYYRRTTDLHPRNPEGRFSAANLYRKQGRFEQAVELYREILRLHPKSASAWHGIALVHDQQGDTAGALEACATALALDPTHFHSHRMRGVLLTPVDPQQAVRELTAAIGIDPGFVVVYAERARAWTRLGRIDAARRDLERVLRHDPNDPEAWRLLDQLDREHPRGGSDR